MLTSKRKPRVNKVQECYFTEYRNPPRSMGVTGLNTCSGQCNVVNGVQMASLPVSPVLTRMTSSTGITKILPSPILPVLADSRIFFTTESTMD